MSTGESRMGTRHPGEREKRIARDADRERVRAALKGGAHHGCYVFDGLMTDEAGMLDYLIVGPYGITAIVVRGEHGDVQADPETRELRLIRAPFKDDPRRQVNDQLEDVERHLRRTDVPTFFVMCFTRAEIKDSGNPEANRGLYKTWGLPKIFGNKQPVMFPDDVDELARRIESIYGRPPFVRPGEPYGGQTI